MDYRILGMIHARVPLNVDCGRVAAAAWLRHGLNSSRAQYTNAKCECIVREVIEQWRIRLRSCVRAEGGHEHFL